MIELLLAVYTLYISPVVTEIVGIHLIKEPHILYKIAGLFLLIFTLLYVRQVITKLNKLLNK